MNQILQETDRQKFLGGSDMAAIFGVSPWRTPLDLYYDKIKPRSEDLNESRKKFFARRKRQEPVIAEMLQDEYGIKVHKLSLDENPNRYRDEEYPFLAAEIDGEFLMCPEIRAHFEDRPEFCAIPDGTLLNLEFKTVHPFKAGEWGEQGSEEIPLHYAAQIMHGLGVTKRPAALCAALFGLDQLMCFPVMADQETIVMMREKAVYFWEENVQKRIPPDPISMDDVKKLYAKSKGKKAEISHRGLDAIRKIAEYKTQARIAKEGIDAMEEILGQELFKAWGIPAEEGIEAADVKDSAVFTFNDEPVATWGRRRGSYLDQRNLKAKMPEVVKKYTVEHFYRVLTMNKELAK